MHWCFHKNTDNTVQLATVAETFRRNTFPEHPKLWYWAVINKQRKNKGKSEHRFGSHLVFSFTWFASTHLFCAYFRPKFRIHAVLLISRKTYIKTDKNTCYAVLMSTLCFIVIAHFANYNAALRLPSNAHCAGRQTRQRVFAAAAFRL